MRTFGLLGVLALVILVTALSRGGRRALWLGWPFGMLLFDNRALEKFVAGGFILSPQMLTMLSIVMGLAIGGSIGPLKRLKWCLADWLFVLLVASATTSAVLGGFSGTLAIPTAVIMAIVPYFLGRVYLRSGDDFIPAYWPIAVCLVGLVGLMAVEAVTGINLLRWMANGVAYGGGRSLVRFGLTRASGCLRPIKMGLTLVLFLPWALEGARLARAGIGPVWWRLMPWVVALGVACTVSRAAILATVLTWGVVFFFQRPVWRWPIALLGAAVISAVGFFPDQLHSAVLALGDEKAAEDRKVIIVDNQEYTYTTADHRWLLFKLYAQPMREAGPFGYGDSERGEEEAVLAHHSFWSIDNNIIVQILSYGYIGFSLFVLLYLAPQPRLIKIALDRTNGMALFAAALVGAGLAFQVALTTVALMRDYRTFWMFFMGLVVSASQIGWRARKGEVSGLLRAGGSTGAG